MDSGRQDAAAVHSVDLAFDAFDRRYAFRAAPHQHDALHDVVGIVVARDSEPRQIADADVGHVADHHRRALVVGDERAADLFYRMNQSHAPHDGRLRAEIHRLAADIDVGVAERGQYLRDRQSVAHQLALIDGNIVGLRLSAPSGHVNDARHGLEAALQYPVLQCLQVGHRVVGRPYHAITENLADRTDRRNLRLRAVRQGPKLGQPVDDPLLGLLVFEIVGELHLDVGKPEQGDGADGLHVGDAGHLNFQRNGDVALDLLGRLAGALRDHIDEGRYRIRIGLDVKGEKARKTGPQRHDQHDDDQHPLTEGETDDGVHVEPGTATWSMKRPPFVTMRSPGFKPSSTSTNPSLSRPVRIDRYANNPSPERTHTCASSPS